MIRQQRRALVRQIDKELTTIKKTLEFWQKIREKSTKSEDIANADHAIKTLLSNASQLFLKRKSLVLNEPTKSTSRPSDVPTGIPVSRKGEQIF